MPVYIKDQYEIARMTPTKNKLFRDNESQIRKNGFDVSSEYEIRESARPTVHGNVSLASMDAYLENGGNVFLRGGQAIVGTDYVLGVLGIGLFEHYAAKYKDFAMMKMFPSLEKERYDLFREGVITLMRSQGVVLLNKSRDAFLVQSNVLGSNDTPASWIGVEAGNYLDSTFVSNNILNRDKFVPLIANDFLDAGDGIRYGDNVNNLRNTLASEVAIVDESVLQQLTNLSRYYYEWKDGRYVRSLEILRAGCVYGK